MGYKEKYEEALERARQIHNEGKAQCFDVMTKVFPELAEVDGEWIRKNLINVFKDDYGTNTYFVGMKVKDIIAWLEKQGNQNPKFRIGDTIKKESTGDIVTINDIDLKNREYRLSNTGFIPFKYEDLWELVDQKPTNKVEPKFKVGNWVVFNNHHDSVYQVEKIENYKYILRHFLGGSMPLPFSHEDMIRMWTIKDAKNGDILAVEDGRPFIFKDFSDTKHPNNPTAYCGIDTLNSFTIGLDNFWWTKEEVFPATKEQCDKLLKATADAGYTFNFKEKELKKIEQKHAWNKENENRIKDIIYFLDTAKKHYASTVELDACIDWLKSLRPQNRCTYNPYKEIVESITEMCKHYDKVTDLQDFYNNVKVKCKDAKEYDFLFPQNS